MGEKTSVLDCDSLPLWERPFAGIPHLREPDEETEDFPKMVVCDGRVTGSITLGYTRLPLWCLIADIVDRGWKSVAEDRDITEGTQQDFVDFLYYLLEARGDFGRLLCVLADVERDAGEREEKQTGGRVFNWWYHPEMKDRVRAALQRCIDSLDSPPPELKPLKLNITEIDFDGGHVTAHGLTKGESNA